MSEIELIYFPIHGRAFVPRMLFKLSGIEFKDTKIDHATFGKMKPELPLGQLPALKVDGVVYCQTAAIIEFAAEKASLPKLTGIEALSANMVIETVREVMEAMNKTAFTAMSATEDASAKGNAFYGALLPAIPDAVAKIEKVLKCIGATSQVIPEKISVADLMIYNMFFYMNDGKVNGGDLLKEHAPTAVAIAEKVLECSKAAEFNKEALTTPYLPW